MELKELLAELMKLDRGAVVTELQSSAQPIFQAVFDKGHSTATAAARADKERLDGEIANLRTQVTQKDEAIKEMEKKTPDVATVRQQFETQIQTLQKKHKEEKEQWDQQLIAERHTRTLGDLRTKLVEKGVDPDYAAVLSDKAEVKKRVRFNKEGTAEILQADSEVPFAPGKGQDALDLLADELHKSTPAKFQTSTSDRGNGTEKGGGGGGDKAGKFYENIRESAKERQKKQGEGAKPARERLGIPTRS